MSKAKAEEVLALAAKQSTESVAELVVKLKLDEQPGRIFGESFFEGICDKVRRCRLTSG